MSKRKEYIDKLEKQLREWNKQIDDLQARAGRQSREVKKKIAVRMDELKEKRSELKTKLEKIQDSGEEAFDQIKKDSEKLWKDVKAGISDIRSIIKD